jgi:hypothetical protein
MTRGVDRLDMILDGVSDHCQDRRLGCEMVLPTRQSSRGSTMLLNRRMPLIAAVGMGGWLGWLAETCMIKYHCPAAAANLAAHNSLRQEIARLRGHIKDDKLTIADLVQVERTLGAWIQDHICSVDIQLRGCVPPAH